MRISDWNGNTYDTKGAQAEICYSEQGYSVVFNFYVDIQAPLIFETAAEALKWLEKVRDDERHSNTPNP